jgi:putative thioredoxin
VNRVARWDGNEWSSLGGGMSHAVYALAEKDFGRALEKFITVIQKDRYFNDDAARRACIALFILLGDRHPATQTYRRRFDMALY